MSTERIFTLKKGTEVADRFDGVTIPFTVPSTMAEVIERANGEENAIAIFNQAFALNLQKDVKSIAAKDDTTVESLRARAAAFKPEKVRVRDPNAEPASKSSGVVREAKAKASALDLLLAENPALAEKYAAQLAALNIKAPTTNGAEKPAATPTNAEKPARPAATARK